MRAIREDARICYISLLKVGHVGVLNICKSLLRLFFGNMISHLLAVYFQYHLSKADYYYRHKFLL